MLIYFVGNDFNISINRYLMAHLLAFTVLYTIAVKLFNG